MILQLTELMVVVAPAMLLACLGVAGLMRVQLAESTVAQLAHTVSVCGIVAATSILAYMLATNVRDVPLELGDWVTLEHVAVAHISASSEAVALSNEESSEALTTVGRFLAERPATSHVAEPASGLEGTAAAAAEANDAKHAEAGHFHFRFKFVFDRLSIPFVIMSLVLCGVIGAFAFRYLHLEPGFNRFFLFYAMFQFGMVVSSLAGTIETLFFGWELVGLSSALLVAYFHERPAPVKNGLRVWAVYRIADAAFLVAALVLHHLSGSGDFAAMMGAGDWPFGHASLTSTQALLVGSLLLFAAAGKSALVPFSGWLPRAMEGPTPSSAVFYGALSVHLGAFLLLRVSPLLDQSAMLSWMVVGLGAITLFYAVMSARVQTDVKSALAFASLIQVSIIIIEIGLGFRYLALIHIVGHAIMRTLQLVRAPSLLKDISALENAIGQRLSTPPSRWQSLIPPKVLEGLYRFSWERGYLDAMLDRFVVRPYVNSFRRLDRIEQEWNRFVNGPRESRAPNESR